jgi:GTP-binding protein
MLIDRATIFVRSGKGGNGCVSLRREKYVPKGGPDGGDGGRGGNVVLEGDPSLDTLLGLAYSPHFRAGNGQPGRGKSMSGSDGDDCVVPVPLGTLVHEASDGALLGDISRRGQTLIVARGGKGGFGNEHFKSPTNQTPRTATPGEEAEERTLRLELKLIADVGLVGKPNAGKSTLLRAMSKATPKVADYPFTTLSPNLGIADWSSPISRGSSRARRGAPVWGTSSCVTSSAPRCWSTCWR